VPNIYFTADLHFNHRNIIRLCNRNFALTDDEVSDESTKPSNESVQKMNAELICRLNESVDYQDRLYLLGDIGYFKNRNDLAFWLSQIHCKNVGVLYGNHDNESLLDDWCTYAGWNQLSPIHEETILGHHVVMSHYPMSSWNHMFRGSYNLHGHTHGKHTPGGRQYDVGVDNNNWNPVPMQGVVDMLEVEEIPLNER